MLDGWARPDGRTQPLAPSAAVRHPRYVNVQQGRDGKLYPAQMPPPKAWRYRVIVLTHHLAHEQGWTVVSGHAV
jgi:hypothetical protein